jgi:hypothetical protein
MPNASLAAFLKLAGTVRSPKTGFPFEKIDSLIDGRAPNSYADQSDRFHLQGFKSNEQS